MFKDDFVKYLFFLCLVIFLVYAFQPSFWAAHPGIIKFVNPDYQMPASKTVANVRASDLKLSAPSPNEGQVSIAGVSLSSVGGRSELRLIVAKSFSTPIELRGWHIKTSSKDIALPAVRVAPGRILTISSDARPSSGIAPQTFYLSQNFLGSNDTIYLYSKSGELVDKYTY